MGAKDTGVWLYMLCITPSQEKSISQYFKKRRWKTDSFIRVPESHLTVGLGILKAAGGSAVYKKFLTVCKTAEDQPGCAYTSENKQLAVNGAVFHQVGLFDEVIKLAEAKDHLPDTEVKRIRNVKRRTVTNQVSSNSREKKYQRHRSKILGDNTSVPTSLNGSNIGKTCKSDTTIDYSASVSNNGRSTDDRVKKNRDTVEHDSSDTEIETDGEINDDARLDHESLTSEADVKLPLSNLASSLPHTHIHETYTSSKPETVESEETHDNVANNHTVNNRIANNVENNDSADNCIAEARSIVFNKAKVKHEDAREVNADCESSQRTKRYRKNKLKCITERVDRFTCGVCGKVMASEQFYKRHMTVMHSQEAVEKRAALRKQQQESRLVQACPICQKQIVGKYGLQAHMASIHGDAKMTYQCDLCGAVLKFKGSLVQHMQSVHTDKRPYHCDVCNKQFKVLHQLKNHQRRHDPDYIETCIICGKTMKKGQLSGHMKRHNNVRPYKCNSCDKSFFEKQDLKRHMRIHSGEKPYKCAYCNYASTMRGNLTKHLKHVKHKTDTVPFRHTDEQAGQIFYPYPRESMIRSSERQDKGLPLYVLPSELVLRQQEKPYIPQGNSPPSLQHHQQQQQHIPFPDLGSEHSLDKHYAKLKHFENIETVEVAVSTGLLPGSLPVETATSTVSILGSRLHPGGVEWYPSQTHNSKVVLVDSTHIPVNHQEITKVSASVPSDLVDTSDGQGPSYTEEGTLYTLKPARELGYVEEQRSDTQEGQGDSNTRDALQSQHRENYIQYMMAQVPDDRYHHT